jgi:hypothetical protein
MQELTQRLKNEVLAEVPSDDRHFWKVYKDKPITVIKTYYPQIKWPKKFRYIFAQIWTGKAGKKVIITGPRGGGKSVLMGALGFALWLLRQRSIVDMGGSLAQAKIVYGYFSAIVYSCKAALRFCKKDPLMENTESHEGNYFKALPASPKAVRGPHPDVLMADEACEAKDEILADALPMVTSSPDPLTIITSTFHKVFGAFQEIWDQADELGYTRFTWDIFDVTKTFDPAIWNDKELNRQIPDLHKLKDLANGRTGDPDGWVHVENIIDAWQGKRSLDWFLVEFMGTRPSAAGLVLDPVDVEAAMFDSATEKQYNYKEGAEVVGGLDWGFSSMTSWVCEMNHADAVKVTIQNRNYTQVASETIIEDVCADVKTYGIRFIYADSAGKFENDALQRELNKRRLGCKVIEVVFSKEKDEMLGNYRAHFQNKKKKIPTRFQEAKWQHKRYRYVEGTNKAAKKDDHIPDATMCALKHWPLGIKRHTPSDLPKVDHELSRTISRGIMKKRF